tara:strand:- start:111 stop:296 length:186 start_codon:yes stop_codon:yes gene_type:complete
LTKKEVSKLIRVSVSTINRLIKKRRICLKSKNIAKKNGFYEKGNRRIDRLKMRIHLKKGII